MVKLTIDEIVPTSKSYYNLVKDWNIYEFKVPSTTLSFISRNRTGKIGINFSIEQRLVPTIKDSYGEYQGEITELAQTPTENGYYIIKALGYEYQDSVELKSFDLNDILVYNATTDVATKISAYSNRGSTPTTLYSVDPSLLNDNFETIEPSLTAQIVQQVNDNTGDIVLLFQNVGVNNATLVDLENRISVNEQDIDKIEDDLVKVDNRVDNIIVGTIEGASAQEIIDARQGEVTLGANITKVKSQLAEMTTINQFYINPKIGKKIAIVGDSTSDTLTAPALHNRLAQYTQTGGILEGATIYTSAFSGETLEHFLVSNIEDVITQQPDLIIISYGINDIVGGAKSKEQIKEWYKIAIDRFLNETKAFILLRTQATFLTTIANAQKLSDDLYWINESFRGYNKRIDVLDIPTKVFGRVSLPTHPYMYDNVHPNYIGYRATADEIATHISQSYKKIRCNKWNFKT